MHVTLYQGWHVAPTLGTYTQNMVNSFIHQQSLSLLFRGDTRLKTQHLHSMRRTRLSDIQAVVMRIQHTVHLSYIHSQRMLLFFRGDNVVPIYSARRRPIRKHS